MKNYIELKNVCGIYAIVNKINNKKYIGSSKNIYQRFIKHRCDFNLKKHNRYFQYSWDKYGEKKFDLILLEECKQKDLLIREKILIELHNVCDTNYGYNVNSETEKPPSWKGKKHSKETKRKISENQKGKKLSEEHKKMIGDFHRGKTISDEQKKKMSLKLKGEKNPMYGKTYYEIWVEKYGKKEADKKQKTKNEKGRIASTGRKLSEEAKKKISIKSKGRKHTEEVKKKMSETRKGRKASKETKEKMSKMRTGENNSACKIKDVEAKNIFKRLKKGESVIKIAKEYNVCTVTIRNIKSGKRQTN